VPIGLLADFEEHFKFISQHVRSYGKGPYLYGLFGSTFGSLDRPELSFMNQLHAYMENSDELMLDVCVVKAGEDTDNTKWGPGTKRFFARGAARRLGISTDEVFNRFDELISLKRSVTTSSPIAGTQVMTLSVDGRPFARARRYSFNDLNQFFNRMGFQTTSKLWTVDGPYNIGLFSLRKKTSTSKRK